MGRGEWEGSLHLGTPSLIVWLYGFKAVNLWPAIPSPRDADAVFASWLVRSDLLP